MELPAGWPESKKTGSPRPKPGNPTRAVQLTPPKSLSTAILLRRLPDGATLAEFICPAGSTPGIVVAHWFATPTSTFSLSTWPLPSSHPRLSEKSRMTPLLDLILPQSRINGLARNAPPSHESDGSPPGSSLWVWVPSSVSGRSVHSTRPYLSRYVPPSSFHTTSTAYSTSTPSEVSLENHSWGSCPSGVLPRRPAPLITELGDPHSVGRCPPALGGGRVQRHRLTFKVLRPGATVAASFWFPIHRGPPPLGRYFLEP
jgi:hypothetical protein